MMRWYLVLAVCLAGMLVFAACGGSDEENPRTTAVGPSGSGQEFAQHFRVGDSAVSFSSLDVAVGEADLVVAGRIVDVEGVGTEPGEELPYIFIVVEVNEVIGGRLSGEVGDSPSIRVVMVTDYGTSVADVRSSIPEGGIDSVHVLTLSSMYPIDPSDEPVYFHSADFTVALRGDGGQAIGFGLLEASMQYFNGGGTFEAVAELVKQAPLRLANGEVFLDRYLGTWKYGEGGSGPLGDVNVYRGAEHCDLQDWVVVSFRTEEFGHIWFVRVPPGSESPRHPIDNVDLDATIPEGIPDSGYGREDARLFVAPDLSAAWVTFDGQTERWPRQDPPLVCS